MIAFSALVASVIALIIVLRLLNVERRASIAIQTAHQAISVISDPELSDAVKEQQARQATLSLLKDVVALLAIAVLAVSAAALFVVGGDLIGLFSIHDTMDIALSWWFILISTVGSIALWIMLSRVAKPASESERDEVPYSALDQALHNKAFASPGLQKSMSRLEDRIWQRKIAATQAARPVLITSLPRAGTTILLELLARQPEFASATYRNMPFTLSPLLWGRFSSLFRKPGEMSERAHGDGIAVGFDSPEAFEEMIWMAFWRQHYQRNKIVLWDHSDRDTEFEEFMAQHMRKTVLGDAEASRYVSKNNANIARLPLLSAAFPGAQIIVPVRDPASQIASLMRQHKRFTDLHSRDRFARQYMEWIGHFEFGAALRPIAFPGAPEGSEGADCSAYWLRYWNAAYTHVLEHAPDNAIFVDHAALSDRPEEQLPKLAEALSLADPAALLRDGSMFRPSRPAPDLPDAPVELLDRAKTIHAALVERAL